MLNKVLVANRGEIAVRIIRACRELGVRSVAVFSEDDRFALHVKKADEAYCLGEDPLSGYLSPQKLVDLASATGCDGLHPGYGFLSENAELPKICALQGISFVGPNADVIHQMGDKTEARKSMLQAGVPVTPGTEENLVDINDALKKSSELGYPIMLKATSGGGGRGIRRCDNEAELRQNYDRVISEATKAFGRADVFLEKCIVNPRHIEVQVLADGFGNTVHLYERDCSIQRRNQKLIEIAPSPQLSQAQREKIGGLAVTAAKAVGYQSAGTVEFLLDSDGSFYFMEMNTRVQVEHTITEEITGVDIVQEQLLIASGQPLSIQQKDVKINGFAMQFRINAEDPQNDFLPSFGRISRYYAPGGPGVRTDTAIYTGYTLPPFYDSLCAKLVVWARDWHSVVKRSQRALDDVGLSGIKTTIPYYQEILKSNDFYCADFNTSFVDAHPELTQYTLNRNPEEIAAVIAAALSVHSGL